jgi:murein L,D-transpeptidase YafK
MAIRPGLGSVLRLLALLSAALLALAGCNYSDLPKQERPVSAFLSAKMRQLGMKDTAPIFIRIFKEDSQMEIWKQRDDGRYGLLKTYSICKWSGALGPKKVEGDRQAPEGFYTVTPAQMNPNSNYYLSFNIGYPNAYDRSLGRTGSNLMVHGACSSSGCYSMSDEDAGEIFSLARDAFRGGQRAFEIQAFPFRMTAENLAMHRDDPNMDFWRMLKVGYDSFELTHVPPKVDVCDRHYVFNADAGDASFDPSAACPAFTVPQELADALQRKQAEDDAKFAQAVAMIEQKQMDEAARAKAAAERAANPSLLQRVLGVQPQALSPAPATPVTPPRAEVSAVPAKMATVPTPKPAPALAAATPLPAAPKKPVLAPATTASVAPAAGLAPAATSAAPGSVANTAATVDDGKIAPGMTPEIQPVGKFVKKKFLWPGDDTTEDGSVKPSG